MCHCLHEWEKCVTISAVPPLVKGLLKSTQSAAFESATVQAFQLTAVEQLQSYSFSDTAPNTVILSTALDPRFERLKFLTPDEVLNVQTLALGVRREMEEQQHGSLCDQTSATSTITTAAEPTTPVSLLDALLNFENSSEEENGEREAQDLNSQVKNEVLTYFEEKLL